MPSIAIVGAGMAGLACAERLAQSGVVPTIFDKGRRPSGRLAARRVELDGHRFDFDYGAQYMTARDPGFAERVSRWAAGGLVARWPVAGDDAWVGTPSMDAPVAAMATDRAVRWSATVGSIERRRGRWHVAIDSVDAGPFDELVLAMPAEQAAALAASGAPALAALAARHRSGPCWTVMLGFDRPLAAPPLIEGDAVFDRAFAMASKPGRASGEGWTIHARPDWSAAHLEYEREAVIQHLYAALASRVPDLPAPVYATAHRWRFARSAAAGIGHYRDAALGLTACGDWLIGPRVESAWRSGTAAAEAILAHAGALDPA